MFAKSANNPRKYPPVLRWRALAFLLFTVLTPLISHGGETPECIVSSDSDVTLPWFDEDERDQINVSADSTRASNEGGSVFEGGVVIEQHGRRIKSNHAEYYDATQNATLQGNITVVNENMRIGAEYGKLGMKSGAGIFDEVDFVLKRSGLRGHAQSITANKNESSVLKQAYITSCAPEDNSWRFDADTINLDYAQEYGYADDVVLRFKDVPFFYTPYIEFPIGDRRRSGLLIPAFGDSSSRGFELSIPWYWNIAPNQDAILAPHFMQRRGTQLDTQYRFLTHSSEGQFDAAYLHHDAITDESRHQLRYQQHSDIASNLKLDVDIQDVSDTQYFNDFSNDITGSSTTHLNRSTNLVYTNSGWRTALFAQTYETVDESIAVANRPYRRLPQLTLEGDETLWNSPLDFSFSGEWVEFDHEDNTRTTGARTTLKPGLSLPLQGAYWFTTPAVSYNFTSYDVKDGNGNTLGLEQRTLTTSSLDAGLFFERSLDDGLVQTLEPRLYYLHVPFEDQSTLPLFDTSIPDFSVAQLFRDNRFNGGDRIGDANQLTLALSSRLLNPITGNELLRASLGQILYFDDRLVTLSGVSDTSKSSGLIGEISAGWQSWRSTASLQWDSESRHSEKQNFFIHYQSDEHYTKHTRIFNVGYRMRDDGTTSENNIEQGDISFVSPISSDYAAFARWNYSIKDKRDIDVIGGLSYDSCCWSIQLLAQRRLDSNTTQEKYDNAVMVQLVLKGLGSVSGNSVNSTLSRAIPGYTEE